MKLVDKMVLFSRFLKENEKHKLNLTESFTSNKNHFIEQSRYWKDKSMYDYLDSTLDNLQSLHNIYNKTLDEIDKKTNELLREQELIVLRRDYDVYAETKHSIELALERRNLDENWIEIISAEIGNYSSWQYPGINLNPTDGTYARVMLSCDPLYMYSGTYIDKKSIKSKFNDFFVEKRLLFYENYKDLPQQQLGLAVSINQYEFMPIDPIKDEMKKIFNLLRSGGYFIFTYSNCEYEAQLDLLSGPGPYVAYNTETLMTSMVEMLGFDVVKKYTWKNIQSYMIVKKPGDLTTQKLGGPLVAITDKI